MVVADNSLVIPLVLAHANTEEALRVRARDAAWIVPPLWPYECLNVLRNYHRGGFLTEEEALRAYSRAVPLVRIEPGPFAPYTLTLAMRHGLTAYDATYAQMALDRGIEFVTYDRDVIQAGLGIHPADFLARP